MARIGGAEAVPAPGGTADGLAPRWHRGSRVPALLSGYSGFRGDFPPRRDVRAGQAAPRALLPRGQVSPSGLDDVRQGRDDDVADPAVSVPEGVDGLEVGVPVPEALNRVRLVPVGLFQLPHEAGQEMGRGWDVERDHHAGVSPESRVGGIPEDGPVDLQPLLLRDGVPNGVTQQDVPDGLPGGGHAFREVPRGAG